MSINKQTAAKCVHDLRKPMNNVSMQAELIKMLVAGSEHEKQITEAADKIIKESKACSSQLQSFFEQLEPTLDG